MKRAPWIAASLAALALAGLVPACGQEDLETRCASWAQTTCAVMRGCCAPGTQFDPEACQILESTKCLTTLQEALVRASDTRYDDSTALACLGTIATCADLAFPAPPSVVQQAACSQALQGTRPPGSWCAVSAECHADQGFALCYDGLLGGTSVPNPVCVEAIVDDKTCSYVVQTAVLHVCPDGKYCDLRHRKPGQGKSHSELALDFSAPCNDLVPEGGSCVDTTNDAGVLPCAPGLYCDITGGSTATCRLRKAVGVSCANDQGVNECAAGLVCRRTAGGTTFTCQTAPLDLPACNPPPVCGDFVCSPGENSITCPGDCGTLPMCGNGACEMGENALTCPADCGPDFCGNGLCGPMETFQTCPSDCTPAICGDGICAPTESPTTCPSDCNSGCRQCACVRLQSQGGCADLCDSMISGFPIPDFCNGLPAMSQCTACIEAVCGQDPATCH